jgi:L-threonylcarbamoyladenylate synthase
MHLFTTKIGTDIQLACKHLNSGDVVAIPTETVYGLAANALNEAAVLQVFEIKNRPFFDPLIIHLPSVAHISDYVVDFPEPLRVLADQFMPGPLTLLLTKKELIPDLVTSGLNRVAVRVPAHPLAQALLEQLDFPLAAPSANPFGYVSPTSAQHVYDQLQGKLPYILDGGSCAIGLESTIVGMEGDQITVYRLGGMPIEAIEEVVGSVVLQVNQSSDPKAPGMLKSHYAPRKPLIFCSLAVAHTYIDSEKRQGVIAFDKAIEGIESEFQILLSRDGDFREAAKNVFHALRLMDQMDIDQIIAIQLPDRDLGRAINDRLRRAAS